MSKLVMIFDDNQPILDLYEILLLEEGYEVIQSLRVPGNLEPIKRLQPDLVVMDYMFNCADDGWQFVQKMYKDLTTNRIPVILCSADYQLVRKVEKDLIHRNVTFVLKPFDIAVFIDAVNQSLTFRPNPTNKDLSKLEFMLAHPNN